MVVLAPVPAKERVEVIDVLRGFALFGVLLANALWYFSGFADLSAKDILQLPANVLDAAVFELELFFVSNKFISIFSFLFGMGFALQMRRAEERQAPVKHVYVRRMLWLFALGIAHSLLAFYGDVLHLYAVLGLLLVGWVARSESTLIGWGLAFAVVAPVAVRGLLWGLSALTQGAIDAEAAFEARRDVAIADHAAFAGSSYADMLRANAIDLWTRLSTDVALTTALASFGKFLLGVWAGRTGLLQRASSLENGGGDEPAVGWMRRGLIGGLVIGVACEGVIVADAAFPALDGNSWGARLAETALWHTGVLALATSYVCGIVLLFRRPDWNRTLSFLAPVGRMALTNYLGQSIACIVIFYGVGLGWYGRVGPTAILAISVLVFVAQAAASAWWLRRFQYGPAEWAWRSLTYGRRQPFRLDATNMGD
jgi:uncharacterized protein